MTNDKIRMMIAEEMQRQGVSLRSLARQIGVNHTNLVYYLGADGRSIASETLLKMLSALNLKVEITRVKE